MAIIDTRTLPDEGVIETDICVIGSGAAGLAIAARLQGRKQSVAVLESGGLEPDAATQSLYRGENIGLPHAPLDTARLRFFGGTTNHWTAHVRKLEPIDFAQRSWVPHSGWPFSRETLEPFYEDARKFLGLSESAFQLAPWMARGRRGYEERG
jgi:choline dehydrogenase-like flavoprotein